MISFVFGIAAALLWGTQNVLLASESRRGDPRVASFWFVAYQVPLAVPALILTWDPSGANLRTLSLIAIGGVLQGLGVMLFTRALSIGPVGLLSGLLSLEGAWVAILSIVAGESIGLPVGIGLLLATAGGVLMVVSRAADVPGRSILLVLATISLTATGLFILSYFKTNIALTMIIYNAASALAIWVRLQLLRESVTAGRFSSMRLEGTMLTASAFGVLGLSAFTIGSQAESAAVTAVLAAQFASLSAVIGYFAFGEKLRKVQVLGFLILASGVGLVAAFA
mgnify:CR=1 FL=1